MSGGTSIGPQGDLDAFVQWSFRPHRGVVLAQVLCTDPPGCGTLDYIDGAIDADLFDVTVDPGARTGTWSFDGLTTQVNPSVSREWFVRLIVLEVNYGHVSHDIFWLTEPGDGRVNLFAGGPIAWAVSNPFAISTAGLIFYGNANRVPEPSLLALLALGVGMSTPLIARRARSQRRT